MTFAFSDDLISAYLDGELAAEEKALVEAQLRDSAELRRLCEELRALRAVLRTMPEEAPPGDLSERILRQAERRMLLGDVSQEDDDADGAAGPAKPEPASDSESAGGVAAGPVELAPERVSGWSRHQRLLATCAASAAALLLVGLMSFSQLSRRFVATTADSRSPAGPAAEPTDAERYSGAAAGESLEALAESATDTEPAVERGWADNTPSDPSAAAEAPAAPHNGLRSSKALNRYSYAATPDQEDDRGAELGRRAIRGDAPPAAGKAAEGPAVPASEPLAPARAASQADAVGPERGRGYGSFGGVGGGMGGGQMAGGELQFGVPPESTGRSLAGSAPAAPAGQPAGDAADSDAAVMLQGQDKSQPAIRGLNIADQRAQWMRELEEHDNLLVQLRMPRSLRDAYLGLSPAVAGEAVAGQAGAARLNEVEYERRANAAPPQLQWLFDSSSQLQVRRNAEGIFVVEGERAAVRDSLARLLSSNSEQIQFVSAGPAPRLDESALSSSAAEDQPTAPGLASGAEELKRKGESSLQRDVGKPRQDASPADEPRQRLERVRDGGAGEVAGPVSREAAGQRGDTTRAFEDSNAIGKTLAEESRSSMPVIVRLYFRFDPGPAAGAAEAVRSESTAVPADQVPPRDATQPDGTTQPAGTVAPGTKSGGNK